MIEIAEFAKECKKMGKLPTICYLELLKNTTLSKNEIEVISEYRLKQYESLTDESLDRQVCVNLCLCRFCAVCCEKCKHYQFFFFFFFF